MLIIGLTGSIATGKSTVSSLLSSPPHSLPLIDADVLARVVVEPDTPAYHAIVSHFLPSTPDLLLPPADVPSAEDAQKIHKNARALNRPALGRRVFADEQERRVLNGIVHPAVRRELLKRLVREYLRGSWAVVLDVPLLYESGFDLFCGSTVVVAVSDPAVQLARLRARDPHLTEQDARDRIGAQEDVREKAKKADIVIWNDSGKEELIGEVKRVVDKLGRGRTQWWWRWGLVVGAVPLTASLVLWVIVRNLLRRRLWERERTARKAKL